MLQVSIYVISTYLLYTKYNFFFFFKQKTAYKIKECDWSSDVCSSDLRDDSSARVMLLEDIWRVFQEQDADRLFSADLAAALVEMEDRPWPEWRRGNPLSPAAMSRLLKPFGVHPRKLRIGAETKQGYELDTFFDSFARYLPFKPEHPEQLADRTENSGFQTGTFP